MRAPRVAVARWLCALAAACSCLTAAASTPDAQPAVRDLDYGDVLFHFYQGDQFGALARLMAAEQVGRVPHHAQDAALLRGGLYLSFGLHREAAKTFEQLLDASVSQQTQDRAWYFLASIRAQRGYTDEALASLERIRDSLPEELAAEKLMLHARVLMSLQRHADAVALLEGWQGPAEWRDYARFNLGVALISSGNTREGLRLLEKVGARRKARTSEMQALRDRVNLALGFTHLRDGDALAARAPLQRVRLEGPFSNKALLGLGWADSSLQAYAQALVPWQLLAQRDPVDPAVQESLLAVPHALAQLNAQSAAAQGYLDAVSAYEAEIGRLDDMIALTRKGGLPERLLANDRSPINGWFWRLDTLSENLESRYLSDLLADDAFQESLQDYRDLRSAADNLRRWRDNLGAYDTMVRTRQVRFGTQLPKVDARLADDSLSLLQARAKALAERVERIAQTNDTRALANTDEVALWQRVDRAAQRLQRLGNTSAVDPAAEKLRLFNGLLMWDANAQFPQRLWAARKAVRQINTELELAEAQHDSLARSLALRPQGFDTFDQRIADADRRIAELQKRTLRLLADSEQRLIAMAVEALDLRRERLEAYRMEAQFALATIYDRAAQASLRMQP